MPDGDSAARDEDKAYARVHFFLLRKRFRWCNTSNWTKVSSSTSNRRHPSTQRNYGITTYGRIEHRSYIMASPIHSFAYTSNMTRTHTHTLSVVFGAALDGNILNRPHTSCTPSHSNVLQWMPMRRSTTLLSGSDFFLSLLSRMPSPLQMQFDKEKVVRLSVSKHHSPCDGE